MRLWQTRYWNAKIVKQNSFLQKVNRLSTKKKDLIMNHRDVQIAEEQENNKRLMAMVAEIEITIEADKEDQVRSGKK
jgi:hypothetical protein